MIGDFVSQKADQPCAGSGITAKRIEALQCRQKRLLHQFLRHERIAHSQAGEAEQFVRVLIDPRIHGGRPVSSGVATAGGDRWSADDSREGDGPAVKLFNV